MTSIGVAYKGIEELASAATATGANSFPVQQGVNEREMTLTQLATFMATNLGTVTFDDITVSSMTVTALTPALSAFTFTTTGQTSAAISTVTSAAGAWGFATKGQIEALVVAVDNNKTAIDELRS